MFLYDQYMERIFRYKSCFAHQSGTNWGCERVRVCTSLTRPDGVNYGPGGVTQADVAISEVSSISDRSGSSRAVLAKPDGDYEPANLSLFKLNWLSHFEIGKTKWGFRQSLVSTSWLISSMVYENLIMPIIIAGSVFILMLKVLPYRDLNHVRMKWSIGIVILFTLLAWVNC